MVSIFGAGLLVGAALLIIIPEGLMVLISSEITSGKKQEESSDDKVNPEFLQQNEFFDAEALSKEIGIALTSGFMLMMIIDQISHMVSHS